MSVQTGQTLRARVPARLADMQYQQLRHRLQAGTYRVVGDVIELFPAYEQFAVRFELFGDEVEAIQFINPVTGEILASEKHFFIFPAVHHAPPTLQSARGHPHELDGG